VWHDGLLPKDFSHQYTTCLLSSIYQNNISKLNIDLPSGIAAINTEVSQGRILSPIYNIFVSTNNFYDSGLLH